MKAYHHSLHRIYVHICNKTLFFRLKIKGHALQEIIHYSTIWCQHYKFLFLATKFMEVSAHYTQNIFPELHSSLLWMRIVHEWVFYMYCFLFGVCWMKWKSIGSITRQNKTVVGLRGGCWWVCLPNSYWKVAKEIFKWNKAINKRNK